MSCSAFGGNVSRCQKRDASHQKTSLMQFFQHHLPRLLPHLSPKVHGPYMVTIPFTSRNHLDKQKAK